MAVIEHSLTITPDELQCLVCAMAGNFPERFGPIRMDLLRKLAKAQHTDTRGAVAALERIARMHPVDAGLRGGDVARAALEATGAELTGLGGQ